ncbi:mannose-1-phosphate guanyltransferase [Phlyctochytrium planicorne]|nr:mannose-1-phosphate guanyltransferase [Phlyctochytrium planicorne]
MKALILVGGYGTRLRPLTFSNPKPLVDFANKPMILHQIEAMAKVGVKDVVLAVNYQPDVMVNAMNKVEEELKVKIHFSIEPEPLGTAGPLALARSILTKDSEPFFVLNSDVICEFPFQDLLSFHKAHGGEGTIMTTKVEDPSKFGVVLLKPGSTQIQRFVEKPKEFVGDQINAGIYIFNPSVLDRIQNKPTSIEKDVFPYMARDGQLHVTPLHGFWADVGQPKDFLTGTGLYLNSLSEKKSAALAPSTTPGIVGNVLISDTATIGKDCKIGPNVVIGPGVTIGNGVRLNRCVIMRGSTVKDARLDNTSVLGEDVHVSDEVFVNGGSVLPHKNVSASIMEPQIVMPSNRKGKKETPADPETFESLLEAASDFEDQGDRYKKGTKARNNYEHACEKYEAAVALNSSDADAVYNWGRVLFVLAEFEFPPFPIQKRLQMYQKSIQSFRQARNITQSSSSSSQSSSSSLHTDILFNLARALQSYAEVSEDEDWNINEIHLLLDEANEMFGKVYEAQQHDFEELGQTIDTDMDQLEHEHDHYHNHHDHDHHADEMNVEDVQGQEDEEVYVDVEPLTASTIIDTLIARMEVLMSLAKHTGQGTHLETAGTVLELALTAWLPKLPEDQAAQYLQLTDRIDQLAFVADLGIAAASLLRAKGEKLLQMGNVDRAGRLDNSSSSSSSSSSTTTASLTSWREHYDIAITVLQRILQRHPKCTEAACDRGDALVELADACLASFLGSSSIEQRKELQRVLDGATAMASSEDDLSLLDEQSQTMVATLRNIYNEAAAAYTTASQLESQRGSIHIRLAEIDLFRSYLYPSQKPGGGKGMSFNLVTKAGEYYRAALKGLGFIKVPTAYKQTDDDLTARLAFLGLARVESVGLTFGASDATITTVKTLLTNWRRWGGGPEDLVDAIIPFASQVSELPWFKDLTFLT